MNRKSADRGLAPLLGACLIFGCHSGSSAPVSDGGEDLAPLQCHDGGTSSTPVAHVIIIVQENHTFDTYFGSYCTAAPGSDPACTQGPSCCEAAPLSDPSGALPVMLDDAANAAYDPNHEQACELGEIDHGKMDAFVTGTACSSPNNFAVAPAGLVSPYHMLASQYALADRYFQPIAGQSSSNDMYLAVAKEVFLDNTYEPAAPGDQCSVNPARKTYSGQQTIADLLKNAGHSVAWYAEGYADMVAAGHSCPQAPSDCPLRISIYPCIFDPSDIPFLYYAQFLGNSGFMRDYAALARDLAGGTLPDVAFVKGLGYHSEHPGYGTTISAGVNFVTDLVRTVGESCYKDSTLILLTWDEGGGYFDHVAPPADSTVDQQPYGTRIPLLAIGHYARQGTVSHVPMEHSSIVKFLEWNYLNGVTGQLGGRDAVVNNIGSLLDPSQTGPAVP